MKTILLVSDRGVEWLTHVPQSRRERRRGLLGLDSLPRGEALLIERARSVHTIGMRFPITVALLDDRMRVRRVLRLRNLRLVLPRPRVRHVLECAVDSDVRRGDRLLPILARFPYAGGGARAPIV